MRRERLLCLAALVLTIGGTAVMAGDRRIPRGGESRVSFDVPEAGRSGLVPARLLPPLPHFYAGLLLEGLVLLAGAWLLARRLFRSPLVVYFVSVAAAGSALWADDVWLNFRAFFAVPLLLHLIEEFLESGARRALVLAGAVACAQVLGLPPGMVPVPLLAVASWFAARTLLFGYPLRDRLRALEWGRKDLLPAALLLMLAAPVAILWETPPPSPAVSSPADVLSYAGLRHPGRYLDFLLGVTVGTDVTSFCGYLTIAFAVLGLALLPRATALRLAGALLASLLALGLVLVALYALVPGLRPARPLPFGAPWVRLFAVFVAGCGLERVAASAPETRAPLLRAGVALLAAAAGLAWLSGTLVLQDRGAEDALLAIEGVSPETQSPWSSDIGLLSDSLGASSLFAALAGATLLLAARARTLPFACALVLLLHPLDVFSWQSRMTWLKTAAGSPEPHPPPSAWIRGPRGEPPRRPLAAPASAAAAVNGLLVAAFAGFALLGSLGLLPKSAEGRKGRVP